MNNLNKCTIFKNIFDKEPYYITIKTALDRIKNGKSKNSVEVIRNTLSKDRQDALKRNLPSVCFSGEFSERQDDKLIQHSGYIVIDFDNVSDVTEMKRQVSSSPYVYACWVSPRNNGVKALIKIADGSRHRQHFLAIKELFPNVDPSGINESRVCYESYDEDIYINENVTTLTKYVEINKEFEKEKLTNQNQTFRNILTWLTNRGDAFVTGERNNFIFKLASACCRFGMDETDCKNSIFTDFIIGTNDFSAQEAYQSVRSAYRSNKNYFGTAYFEHGVLKDKKSTKEVILTINDVQIGERTKDVVYGDEVKQGALDIYRNGYEKVNGIGVEILDTHFKPKRGEITLLTGIGNYGKSTFFDWMMLMRVIKLGEKFAVFSPENCPAEEYYHGLVEIYLGADCTPANPQRPIEQRYTEVYDIISNHIFYVYPKDLSPTPQYIKERFLELIIKENVDGCVIDPFNQMSNDYSSVAGRTDIYLETFLADCKRFSLANDIYFFIIAHPKLMTKKVLGDNKGNYNTPDVFDIAGGAMWNNKMDNILVYDRPMGSTEPENPICDLYTKKIRKQKTVGKKGDFRFTYNKKKRRFYFDEVDPMEDLVNGKQKPFNSPLPALEPNYKFDINLDAPF